MTARPPFGGYAHQKDGQVLQIIFHGKQVQSWLNIVQRCGIAVGNFIVTVGVHRGVVG